MKTDQWVLVVSTDEGPAATIQINKAALERATEEELFFGDLTAENKEESAAILAQLNETGEWNCEDGWIRWYPLWDDKSSRPADSQTTRLPE